MPSPGKVRELPARVLGANTLLPCVYLSVIPSHPDNAVSDQRMSRHQCERRHLHHMDSKMRPGMNTFVLPFPYTSNKPPTLWNVRTASIVSALLGQHPWPLTYYLVSFPREIRRSMKHYETMTRLRKTQILRKEPVQCWTQTISKAGASIPALPLQGLWTKTLGQTFNPLIKLDPPQILGPGHHGVGNLQIPTNMTKEMMTFPCPFSWKRTS